MQIGKLRLAGFKSFVEPAELRIEPGLTGIVGPNGCGKSNLLEAIRWVMGESSPKSMRGGGMDDVIFAGTASRPARDFAEVSLFAETGGGLPPSLADAGDSAELEVVRRIERGAGSAYRVNGRDVRAKDVALIFADAATGAHSPALVSQGKIAAVIAAKPVERRQMLEEAAGIAGLHVRRKDAEQKLRATESNLARLADLLGDMESRIASLRRQARAAERYTRISGALRIAEGRMLFARWRDAAAAADLAASAARHAEQAVSAAQNAYQAAADDHRAAMTALAAARADTQAARDEAATLGTRLAGLTGEEMALTRRLDDLAAQLQRIAEDRAREDDLSMRAVDMIAALDMETKALATALAGLEAQGPLRATDSANHAATLRDAEVALAQARAGQAATLADRRIAEAAVGAARSRLGRAEAERSRIAAEQARLGDVAPLQTARVAAQQAVVAAEQAVAVAEAAGAAAEIAHEKAGRDLAERDAVCAQTRTALATIDSEHKMLTRALDRTRAAAGEADLPTALDSLHVQPGFERALAAALGDDLCLPVGGEATRCWAGAPVRADDPALPPGLLPLGDHVTAPPALARRLAQIGIADRDDGQPLAAGQRLVTRDGRLRRWDGLCLDDDGAPAAETLIRRNRLAALSAELPAARAALDDAERAHDAARHVRQTAESAVAAARQQRTATDADLRHAMRARDEADAALGRHIRDSEGIADRLANIAGECADAAATLAEAERAFAGLPPSEAADARVATLEAATDTARRDLQQARTGEQALQRDIAAHRERQAALSAELKGWRARTGEATKRIGAMAERAAALSAEQADIADMPRKLRGDIDALTARQAELGARLTALLATEKLAEQAVAAGDTALRETNETLSAAREHRAGAAAQAAHDDERRIEAGRLSGERFQCPPPLLPEKLGFDGDAVGDPHAESTAHERLHRDRERMGPVNLVAARELAEVEGEHARSRAESEELQQAVNRLRGSIGSLNREGRARLVDAFTTVNGHFKRLFTTLFDGGSAHLDLIDSDDPLEAGLEIFAQPPGKKLAALTLLSGGEQALTAVALIFGLFLTNPAPICVLDEVDAPLDDANIERFCDLLDDMVRNTRTRYLIVTHNAVTMSRMHRLFGVTMVERGVSRLVSVDLGGAEELLATG